MFRQCVSEQLHPARGIAAGSAFATVELLVLMKRAMDRIAAQYTCIVLNVHVDDLSLTALNLTVQENIKAAVQAFRTAKKELEVACRLPLADDKTTVASSNQEAAVAVAAAIPGARCGLFVKKLGVDFGLSGPRPHVCRNPKG